MKLPLPSRACRRQIHWPSLPPANAPTLPRLSPLHATHAPPANSPAATVSPLSDLCTLVRIEPLSDIRAPKVPILFRRQLICWGGRPPRHRGPNLGCHSTKTGAAHDPN